MENFLAEIIEKNDDVYVNKIKEMFNKTNVNQYYQLLREALRECWDTRKIFNCIPDEFINEYSDLYYKLFEENLQMEIPEKLYIDNPERVSQIWFNALNSDNNHILAKYLKQKIDALKLDNTFREILKIYNYKNAYLIKQKYNLKVDEIDKFELYKEKYYDEIVYKSNNINEVKEAIANLFVNSNTKDLQNFINKIQDVFLKRKQNINNKEKCEKLQKLKNLILPLFSTRDIYKAKEIYNAIKKSGFSYNDVLIIEENIKRTCSQDLINNLSYFDSIPDLIKDNVPIFDISEKDFKLLIHNTGWGHHESEEAINERLSDLNNWNNGEGDPFISTSYISNEMLGHVKSRENTDIIYGFNKSVDPSLVINMGNGDIETLGKDINNLSYEITAEWFMANDLLENMIYGYNEVAIKRVYDKNGERIQPNYIVSFDTIKESDLQYAKHFNIPIYFVDSAKCMERTLKKYDEIVKDKKFYENSDNILRMCGKIISFGFGLEYNKQLQEKYAERDILKEYIINCRNNCDNKIFIKLLEKIENLSKEEKSLKNISKVDREKVIELKERLLIDESKQNDPIERY